MEIVFSNTLNVPEEYSPYPAHKNLPSWYKDLESYIGGEKRPNGNGNTTATIKRCMPVFDSLTAGYIIPTYTDIFVSQKDVEGKIQPFYEWPLLNPISFHPVEQAPKHPIKGGHTIAYPKWNNSWSIKTPPGYSILILQPLHRESIFTIFSGVVDTDTYVSAINFPFALNDAGFTGLIPAGTPMAQIIPFKRESWQMRMGDAEALKQEQEQARRLRVLMFDSYKRQFRQVKEYK